MFITSQMNTFLIIFVTILASALPVFNNAKSVHGVYHVMRYGAVGNGVADDTSAFQKAWKDACNAKSGSPVVDIPADKVFLVQPLRFTGPCKTNTISFIIRGAIKAASDPKKWEIMKASNGYMGWLMFENVHGLVIKGGGLLDGQGKKWWDIHCRDHPGPGCIMLAPTILTLDSCNDVLVRNLHFKNSPQTHVLVYRSRNVRFSFMHISAPEKSPNTDGIHIASSTDVSITKTNIASGDDCVSIGDQTSKINVTFVNCGPGHGVSIGSLGKGGANVAVEDIRVWHVNFTGTTNGGRIKTWQAGTGYVRHVEFMDLHFSSVQNPIIIDQYYCDRPHNCPATKTGVHIDNISYVRATGTSKTKNAINLSCSSSSPCTNIVFDTINLNAVAPMKEVTAFCKFAHGIARGTVIPSSCLSR